VPGNSFRKHFCLLAKFYVAGHHFRHLICWCCGPNKKDSRKLSPHLVWCFAVGWGTEQRGFGEAPSAKTQLMHLVRSIRTVMRSKSALKCPSFIRCYWDTLSVLSPTLTGGGLADPGMGRWGGCPHWPKTGAGGLMHAAVTKHTDPHISVTRQNIECSIWHLICRHVHQLVSLR